jgi:hypothetical protein
VEIAASEKLVDLEAEGFDAGIRQVEFIAHDMTVVPGPREVAGWSDGGDAPRCNCRLV